MLVSPFLWLNTGVACQISILLLPYCLTGGIPYGLWYYLGT